MKIRKKEKLDMANKELKEKFIDEKTGIEYFNLSFPYLPSLLAFTLAESVKFGK